MILLGCAFVILIGIVMVVKPDVLWEMEHYFTVKNGEPTDYYLRMKRLEGIVFIVVAIIIFVSSR